MSVLAEARAPRADGEPVARARSARPGRRPDAIVLVVLGALLCLLAALTWRKWGSPEIDPGAELTTADLVAHGATPYQDVRYFYGPLGLYGLALTFKVLGTSFAAAFAFGFFQTIAILGTFYALARQWLAPVAAGLATAVLLAIAFSGTTFDFVLPHTNSATIGLLCLLLELLALSRGRTALAGVALGAAALTRPEFAAVAAGAAAAYVVGTLRSGGRSEALAAAARIALPALALAGSVLGVLAAVVGPHRLFLENLWPVDFMRQAGFRTQAYWMPFDLESLAGLGARALVYGGLLAGLTGAAVLWSRTDGWRRALAAWPVAAVLLGLLALDGAARVLGVVDATRLAIEAESRHLIIGMSWLPALALAVGAWAVVRLVRGGPAPLGRSWPADLALIAAAAGLGLRAYNAFTAEGSYAPYYAAPLILLAALLHVRVAERWPAARVALLAALGGVAAGLAAYALVGLYPAEDAPVRTQRGTFVTDGRAAPALAAVVSAVQERTRPGESILAAPSDGGVYFMTDRRPALYELMLLPGLLDSRADELAAIARLRSGDVRLAVIAARDYADYGSRTFGTDYNRTLGRHLAAAKVAEQTAGDLSRPAAGTNPSRGFRMLELR